jgi:hypothetical protein
MGDVWGYAARTATVLRLGCEAGRRAIRPTRARSALSRAGNPDPV